MNPASPSRQVTKKNRMEGFRRSAEKVKFGAQLKSLLDFFEDVDVLSQMHGFLSWLKIQNGEPF